MQRVDSSTTLSWLIDDLADASVTQAQRTAMVQGHMDYLVADAASEDELLSRAQRVLVRGLQLPEEAAPMRQAVARSLVTDTAQRSPRMAWAAYLAQAAGPGEHMAGQLNLSVPLEAHEELFAAVRGLCLDDLVAFACAQSHSASELQAFVDYGGLRALRLCQDLEDCAQSFANMACTQPEQIPLPRPEEHEALGEAETFLMTVSPQLLPAAGALAGTGDAAILTQLLVLRELLRQTQPQDRARILAYVESEAGRAFNQRAAPMWQDLAEVFADMSAQLAAESAEP